MNRTKLTGQVLRFSGVGVVNSAVYFGLAAVFHGFLALGTVPASVLAYGLAAGLAYLGHKFLTFGHPGPASQDVHRFVSATGLGLLLATMIPIFLRGFAPLVSFVAVLVVVPICSFLMMKFFVFRA